MSKKQLLLIFIAFCLPISILFAGYKYGKNKKRARIKTKTTLIRNEAPCKLVYDDFGVNLPYDKNIVGIDVSHYQKVINWELVKNMQVGDKQIHFAFIKATEGIDLPDSRFLYNWEESRKQDISRGAYHFFRPKKSGKQQAQFFISRVKLEEGDLPPVLDVEVTQRVAKKHIIARMQEWLTIVEAHYGVKPIIYTNLSFYNQYVKHHFEDYPTWIAYYGERTPELPNKAWHFWQHTDKARVSGIKSLVDLNVFHGDSTAFRQMHLAASY